MYESVYLFRKQNYTEDEFIALILVISKSEDAFDGIKFKLNKIENTDLIDSTDEPVDITMAETQLFNTIDEARLQRNLQLCCLMMKQLQR